MHWMCHLPTWKQVCEAMYVLFNPGCLKIIANSFSIVQEPSEVPFNLSAVPKEVKPQPLAEKKAPSKKPPSYGASTNGSASPVDAYEKLLSSIPEFSIFGPLFKSSAPVDLTEAETEYAVNVVKHIYSGHIVFQYNCTNTIPEQLLENV